MSNNHNKSTMKKNSKMNDKNKLKNKYQKMSHREHIYTLTDSYVGSAEKQTVNVPNGTAPESPVLISSFLYAYDDIINVNHS